QKIQPKSKDTPEGSDFRWHIDSGPSDGEPFGERQTPANFFCIDLIEGRVEQPDDIIRIFISGRIPCQRTETCLTIAELANEVKDFRRHAGPLALQSLRDVVEGAASLIQRERVLHEFGAGTLLGKRRLLKLSVLR